jgi:hypothetical protein
MPGFAESLLLGITFHIWKVATIVLLLHSDTLLSIIIRTSDSKDSAISCIALCRLVVRLQAAKFM